MALEPVLTPHGLLTLREIGEAVALESELALRLKKAFARGSGHGLLWLGASEVGTALPPALSYWRELGVRYVTALAGSVLDFHFRAFRTLPGNLRWPVTAWWSW
jgi:hypothetical protein